MFKCSVLCHSPLFSSCRTAFCSRIDQNVLACDRRLLETDHDGRNKALDFKRRNCLKDYFANTSILRLKIKDVYKDYEVSNFLNVEDGVKDGLAKLRNCSSSLCS